MKKIFVTMNGHHGGFCTLLKREYESVEAFSADFNRAKESLLSDDDPLGYLIEYHYLAEIELADDEMYTIEGGLESGEELCIKKIVEPPILSKVINIYTPK